MGLLSTPRLSPVQRRAVDLSMVLEAKAEGRRETEAFKRALLGSDPEKFLPLLYPQAVRKPVENPDEIVEDHGPAAYEFTEEVDPRDAERILTEMLRKGQGSMTMTDVEHHED